MLNRRKFLKVFGFGSLALSLLPTVLARSSLSKHFEPPKARFGVKNWLYGCPRRGCSTPDLAFERQGRRAEGLKDFADLRISSEFVPRIPHEQYLS